MTRRITGIQTGLVAFIADQPRGAVTSDVMAHFGCGESHVLRTIKAALKDGLIVRAPLPAGYGFRYFGSAAAMEAAQPWMAEQRRAFLAERREKQRQYERSRYVARSTPKPPAPAKEPKPGADLIAEPFKRPAAPARGPARLEAPADISAAKIIRAATPPGRFEVPADFRGAFSTVGVGRDVQTGRGW